MKIIVCIKQVPNVAMMKFNPETRTLVREGVQLEVSSFDIRALLKAVELGKAGGEIVALTMGPPQAAKALEHCLALGANRAIHLTDRAFAGADTLATARALAAAIKAEKPDLVFCGRYSTDSETGQVGPEVAELLDLPQATGVRSISVTGATATVQRETDEGFETLDLPLPCLITAAEDLAPERFASKKDREAAKTKTITALTAAQLGLDPATIGQAGSPTWVKEVITTAAKRICTFVTSVDQLVAAIRDRAARAPTARSAILAPRSASSGPAVWVVAEGTKRVTLELLGKGAQLAAALKGELVAVVLGKDARVHAPVLAAHGADRVFVADHAELTPYRTEPHASVLTRAIRDHKPHTVLLPSTAMGRDLAPRVAARLNLGLTGDAIDLRIDGNSLVMDKPAFGGTIVAPILSKTFPQMATVRPGILRPSAPDASRTSVIVDLPCDGLNSRTRVTAFQPAEGNVDLDAADVVVGFGMGIGGPENLPIIRELAQVLKAPLATTRDCTDKGWLPRQHQVGLTGKCIAPRLYFAIGIRGAFEHTVGIQKAGTIVAINNDDQAFIWDSADIGIKGDWKEIVPALAKALR